MRKKQERALTLEEQQIVTDNIGLVYRAAKHFNAQRNICATLRIDWDDYVSLLYIALCKAVRSYDASRGAALTTAFWTIAENEISREFTAASRLRRKINYTAYSLDYISECTDGLTFGEFLLCDEECSREDDILTRIVVIDAINRLPKTERDITIAYFLKGKRQTEIGADYGVTHSRIGQILKQAKDKLKEELEAI